MTLSLGPLRFFFNELSARMPADTVQEGRRRLDDMVDAVATVMAGRAAELISIGEPDFWEAVLSPGWSVADWWATADRDRKGLLGRIADKTELPAEVRHALEDRFYCSEFIPLEGHDSTTHADARGLGAAHLLDGIGVSLLSEEQWGRLRIPLLHRWLDEDCRESEKNVEALNISEPGQAERLSEILVDRRQQGLTGDPSALASGKQEWFPHLSFGQDVDGHIVRLRSGHLTVVTRKLLALDDAARNWRRDPEMTSPMIPGLRPESQPTMEQYGDQRIFRDAEGRKRTYELHVSAGSRRIHLRVLHERRAIEIGYVGKHLDTVKYN